MTWPLEPRGHPAASPKGLEEILVVEEKRALIENQLKEQLYNCRTRMSARASSASSTKAATGSCPRPTS